jgi:hypothetical protein
MYTAQLNEPQNSHIQLAMFFLTLNNELVNTTDSFLYFKYN